MSDTPTPRTDEAENITGHFPDGEEKAWLFARNLEEKLAAANERAESYKQVAEEYLDYTAHSNHRCAKRNCICGLKDVDAKLEALNQQNK